MIRVSELQDPFHEPQLPIPIDLAPQHPESPSTAAPAGSVGPNGMGIPVCEVIVESAEEEEVEEVEIVRPGNGNGRRRSRLWGFGGGSTGHVVPDHAAHVHKDTLAAGMKTDVRSSARRSAIPDGSAYTYPTRGSPSSLTLSVVVIVFVVGFIAAVMYVFFR